LHGVSYNCLWTSIDHLQTINRMPDADGIPAKKMEAMQIEGYLPTAKANLELTDALDKIKVGELTLDHTGVRRVSAAKQHEHARAPMLVCFAS